MTIPTVPPKYRHEPDMLSRNWLYCNQFEGIR
ncbi:hypothetical protein NRB20_73020 [Nocardia sp. RB20]|uniref:Uncharacterized protein n=1 Tax=Nocardia macrotermitis TaxID=2585198 RepID=A0A7K0DEU7_9NOCA|nr:hypothetical protein [Nocardia macrotermitis]